MQQYSDVRLNELLSYVAPTQEPICPSCSQDLLAHIRASQSGELLNINEAAVSAKALPCPPASRLRAVRRAEHAITVRWRPTPPAPQPCSGPSGGFKLWIHRADPL